MKTRIFVGLCVALCWQAKGQTNPASTNSFNPEPSASLTGVGTTNEIETAGGAIYKNAKVERVEPDGLTVSYVPSGGGLGLTKVKFDELANEWRQQYGYDPEKKEEYEKVQKRAAAWWRAQMIANYEVAIARRQAQEKAEAEAEAQAKEEQEKAAADAQKAATDAQKAAADAQKAALDAANGIFATNKPQTNVIQLLPVATNQPQTNVIQPPPPQ